MGLLRAGKGKEGVFGAGKGKALKLGKKKKIEITNLKEAKYVEVLDMVPDHDWGTESPLGLSGGGLSWGRCTLGLGLHQ